MFLRMFSPCFSPYVEPVVRAPFDDIDPEYGLHGYQLHIVLHSSASEIMSASFPQLSCRRRNLLLQVQLPSRSSSSSRLIIYYFTVLTIIISETSLLSLSSSDPRWANPACCWGDRAQQSSFRHDDPALEV